MPIGLQMAQVSHAVVEFCLTYPGLTKIWHATSNYVAILSVDNEAQLCSLMKQADMRGVKYVIFKEPDQNNAITAIALAPGLDSKKLSANIRLAGKQLTEGM